MDPEIMKKIFIHCGKESNCWFTSKFYNLLLKDFDFHLLNMDFPNYKNLIKNVCFRKKDYNPGFIHKLLSYRPKNNRISIQNRYLDLISEHHKIIDNNIKISTGANDIPKIPNREDINEILHLLVEHNIDISELFMNYNAHLPMRTVNSIISHTAFKNLKSIDFIRDILPFNHETLEIFQYTADVSLELLKGKYDLPNLKTIKLECYCSEDDDQEEEIRYNCVCNTVNIMDIFPNSSKLENIDCPRFFLTAPQPNLKKLTISYETIKNSKFSGIEIFNLKVIDDFPTSLSYEDFVELCKKSDLIIDNVEKLTILYVDSNFMRQTNSSFMRYVNQGKIYQKIKIDYSFVYVKDIFQLADFAHYFVIGFRNNILSDDGGDIYILSRPDLLKRFKCSDDCSVTLLDHLPQLTRLETIRLCFSDDYDFEFYYQKLSLIKVSKKISFGNFDIPIHRATKMLQLGNFHKIRFGFLRRYTFNKKIIEKFCSSLAKNKIKCIEFFIHIYCSKILELIEFLIKTMNDKELTFRMVYFYIDYNKNIEERDVRKALYTKKKKIYGYRYYLRPVTF